MSADRSCQDGAPDALLPTPATRWQYSFKTADTAQEITELQRLLYQTFVLEIPRYQTPATDLLVDKYHERNIYFIATRDGCVCGVTAVHDQPPFSVASLLEDPTRLCELESRLLETRILAVRPRERFGLVFAGLAFSVFEHALAKDYGYLAISGLAGRRRMYERLGFETLGPPRQRGREYFLPMLLDLRQLSPQVIQNLGRWRLRRQNPFRR